MSFNSANQQLNFVPENMCPNLLLTLFGMGLFQADHRWGAKKAPFPNVCHTYPTVMNLGSYSLLKEDLKST